MSSRLEGPVAGAERRPGAISLVGLSHHVAPVELRERVTLDLPRAAELARGLGEAVCLSTCNRTELYTAGIDEETAVASLEEIAGEPLGGVPTACTTTRPPCTSSGWRPGSTRSSPARARSSARCGTPSRPPRRARMLDRVFRQALAVGKRVRTETAIGESPASVSSAAAALAAQVFGELRGRRVLLLGAGRIGELAASNLASRGAEIAFVANRSPDAAHELARRFGAVPIGLDEVPARIADVDVVVSSTAAPEPVVRADEIPARRRTPLFFIDIAVPRDLDPEIARLDGCFLYDIDDLEAVVAETLSGRRNEAQRAEQLVAEEVERFRSWHASLDVVPAIASLRARAEQIRAAELEKVRGRVSDDERRTLESVTAQILNKLLHLPTVRMKEAAVGADGAAYADAVRHLFGLEEETR